MPIVIRSEVYVNSVVFPVPYALCNITAAELADMELNGAYTDLSPGAVLPHLASKVVDNGLLKLQMEYHQLLQAAANAAGNVAHLTLRRVVQQLLGHSGVSWGGKPTKMHWLDVLKRCDTKSKVDTRRIIRHGWENPPKGCTNPKIHIKFGDGQTNHRDRDEKKDCPETARGLVVGIGNFHPHAHFMFACITGWWWCVCCCFAEHLGLSKVTNLMKDLEHDNFTHAFTFIVSRHTRTRTRACTCVIRAHVCAAASPNMWDLLLFRHGCH